MIELFRQRKYLQFILLLVIFIILYQSIGPSETNVLWRFPPLIKAFPIFINDSISYLMFEWWPIEVYDPDIQEYEQKPLVSQFTRMISGFILFMIEFIREIMLGGVKTIVTFSGWDWATANPWAKWPGLPWTVVAGGATILGYALNGRGLALLVGLSTSYIALFGQWEPSMQTLSFVLVAAPVSVFIGLWFGVWAFRSKRIEAILNPLLNMAQIVPHFSYLIPVMVFFGIGDHAGAIATVIFATPPMVRLTLLGLKKLPPEVAESGVMSGCNNWQLLTKVLIPTARRDILIGVNQVIMQCLAMVVLASLIGAKGLGIHLLIALNQLKIGIAIEMGICIVLIAIVLDRMSLAWANKQTDYFSNPTFTEKYKYLLMFGVVFILGIMFAYIGTFIFPEGINYLYLIPHNKGISTAVFWQSGVDWIWDTFFFSLKAFNEWLTVEVLMPVKAAYLGMPVVATFTLAMGVGFIVGGIRSALIVGGFLMFIALTEWWDRALITAYLMTVSVLIAGFSGIVVGTLCAQNPKSTRFILTYCDTFQTFPSFIYLIPVMMLFGVTDTSVLIAIIIYATIPALRYTVEGLLSVPESLQDAGTMSGVGRLQRWLSIELPMSFPHMALGINQTVVFALSMVIIGAMIGTDDLGQLILGSLSDRNGVGNGLILGICVACIGLAIDQILRTWANQRKQALGLN
ncbi:MAG: glycine betaine/proline transport system permease protein [Candidatus Paceibacteria bacterium]|jgi:glycine betaine/proline transport system permease protein|tara:strand:- start:1374 stop:3434 length:2061 start_codon:yes stop_codon:yes gene_type:complete